MIKAIIFDLDGVIVSTDEYHYLAWRALADRLGIPFDRERNNLCRGVSRMESLDIVLGDRCGDFSKEEKTALATEKNEMYKSYLSQMSAEDVSADVVELLKELRNMGIPIAIGSSSKNTRLILDNVGLTDMFDAISDGNNITNSKPHPEVFLKAADMLGVPYRLCAVVEDAESGIAAAVAAGMTPIAVGDARKCENAKYKISSLSSIMEILKES